LIQAKIFHFLKMNAATCLAYPLLFRIYTMRDEGLADQPVTAIVRRRIKAGSEASFQSLMQELMTFVPRHPGHLGINVIRLAPDSREYAVLDRFATQEDRRQFMTSPEYHSWMKRLSAVSETDPQIEEMKGLAFWFTLPGQPLRKAPPKVKMALLTFLGVYPLSMIYSKLLAPIAKTWAPSVEGALLAALLIISLTWVVLPFFTRAFEKWLFPPDKEP
jgi:antibiotic biosynthesis monooxygenase (ABM) superfamily enzyme